MAEGMRRTQGIRPDERLTVERIVAAASRMVAVAGLDGLTVNALARELGVTKSAVTWHVPDRRVLIEMVAAGWLNSIGAPPPGEPLSSWIGGFANRYREAALAQPNLARLAPIALASGGAGRMVEEALVPALTSADVPATDLAGACNLVLAAIVGFVELELAHASAAFNAPTPVTGSDAAGVVAGRAFAVSSGAPLDELDESFAFVVERLSDCLAGSLPDDRS